MSNDVKLEPDGIDWTADDNVGPIYRERKPTVADYDEVIADLQAARDDLAKSDWSHGCSVCGDSGCASNICHHNALVAARAWVRERGKHRCYHCGFVAETDEQAQEHFGKTEDEVAKCLRERIRHQPQRDAVLEEAVKQALLQVEKYAEFFCEEDFDPLIDQLRSALTTPAPAVSRDDQSLFNDICDNMAEVLKPLPGEE